MKSEKESKARDLVYAIICFIICTALFCAGMALMWREEYKYTEWMGMPMQMPTYPYVTQGIILMFIGGIAGCIGGYYLYRLSRKITVETIAEGVSGGIAKGVSGGRVVRRVVAKSGAKTVSCPICGHSLNITTQTKGICPNCENIIEILYEG